MSNESLKKIARTFEPYNYYSIIRLEKQGLKQMIYYFKHEDRCLSENSPIIYKELKLAYSLLSIFSGENLYDNYKELYNVNIRNWKRFLPIKAEKYKDKEYFKRELKIKKAWYLYNKLRAYKMITWID